MLLGGSLNTIRKSPHQQEKDKKQMANLTAAEYKAQMDNALKKYEANSFVGVDRGVAWAQIASGYCHLWVHQALFDSKGATLSASALGYRTQAEKYLSTAKLRVAPPIPNPATPLSTPMSIAASQAASVAAYAYVQEVKVENAI